jgi:hypothetical protein
MHPDSMAVVPEIPQSLSTVHSFGQRQEVIGRLFTSDTFFRKLRATCRQREYKFFPPFFSLFLG